MSNFDPYDNSCKQVHEQHIKNQVEKYEPITLLNEIHKQLAKSSLPSDEYNAISSMMIKLSQMLYERL